MSSRDYAGFVSPTDVQTTLPGKKMLQPLSYFFRSDDVKHCRYALVAARWIFNFNLDAWILHPEFVVRDLRNFYMLFSGKFVKNKT
jgi:hypothetical protein